MARKYHQGRYKPKNPHKYVGNKEDIYYRSGWELKFMKWADSNPAIEKWTSEEIVIPYISPVDCRSHRYFVDFAISVRQPSGDSKKYLIEIKPEAQTKPPKRGKRSTNKYVAELATYSINQAKWKQAEEFCRKNNMHWMVLTEKHLF